MASSPSPSPRPPDSHAPKLRRLAPTPTYPLDPVLHPLSPHKLAKAPQRLLPYLLAACCRADDTSPQFDLLRPYIAPTTPEGRLADLLHSYDLLYEERIAAVRVRRAELQRYADTRFTRAV